MDNRINDIQERRRFERALYNLPVSYRNLRSVGIPQKSSLTKDVGEGGIRFKTDEFISLACRLVLEITLPSTPKPIKAISKVAWIKKSAQGDAYEVGNQFLEMAREDKSLIRDFVSSLSKTNL